MTQDRVPPRNCWAAQCLGGESPAIEFLELLHCPMGSRVVLLSIARCPTASSGKCTSIIEHLVEIPAPFGKLIRRNTVRRCACTRRNRI
jgi:hypothetical protein